MKVCRMKINDAEQTVFQAIQRKDRYNAQRDIARASLKQMQERLVSLKETCEALNVYESCVSESFTQAEKTIDAAYEAISKEYGIAIINKEVSLALQGVDGVDRAITNERTRRDEAAKMQHKKEENEQIKRMKEVQAQHARETEEMTQRITLQHQVNTVRNKLILARSQIEEMTKKVLEAEEALDVAQEKVSNGGITAAEAAVQEAISKDTECSLFMDRQPPTISTSLVTSTGTSISKYSANTGVEKSLSVETQNDVESNFSKNFIYAKNKDSESLENQEWIEQYAHSTNDYMNRQTSAVEALTANIHFLTQGLLNLNDTVQHQSKIMNVQSQLFSGEGDKAQLSSLRSLETSDHDSHFVDNEVYEGNLDEKLFDINSLKVSVLEDGINENEDENSHHSNPNSPRRSNEKEPNFEDDKEIMEEDISLKRKVNEMKYFTSETITENNTPVKENSEILT